MRHKTEVQVIPFAGRATRCNSNILLGTTGIPGLYSIFFRQRGGGGGWESSEYDNYLANATAE